MVSARLPLALNALFQKVLDDSRGHYLVQGRWGEILPPSSLRSWPHDQHPKLMNQEEEGRPPPCKFWARLSPGGGPPIVLITWGKLGELQCPPRGWGRCHFSHHPCPYSWPLLTLRYPSNHKRIFQTFEKSFLFFLFIYFYFGCIACGTLVHSYGLNPGHSNESNQS